MIKEMSVKFGDYLAGELSLDQRNRNITVFGLEVIIGGVIKTITFVSIALVLGVFSEALTVLIVQSTLRWVAGGAHCTSYLRCLIVSFLLIFGVTVMGISLVPVIDVNQLLTTSFIIGFLINVLYAPADPPEKPITKMGKRIFLKVVTCAQLVVYFVFFKYISLPDNMVACAAMAIFLEAFTLFPYGRKFIFLVDTYMAKINERRCME